jgi:DNA-binding transcriptional MocR family regulator
VSFLPGGRCDAGGSGLYDGHIRVCFAYLNDDELQEGLERLLELVRGGGERPADSKL